MNELQLKMCDIQGRLFELSTDKEYGSANFVKVFMNSEVAKALDSTYNRMQQDILYWIGYLYRFWHYYTNEDSAKIYKQAPVGTLKRNYMMFHTMAPELAVENLKEIYTQKRV